MGNLNHVSLSAQKFPSLCLPQNVSHLRWEIVTSFVIDFFVGCLSLYLYLWQILFPHSNLGCIFKIWIVTCKLDTIQKDVICFFVGNLWFLFCLLKEKNYRESVNPLSSFYFTKHNKTNNWKSNENCEIDNKG